jgi:predicted nucleic acid-binding protein
MKVIPRIVLDSNVLVAALRSRLGASYALLRRVGAGDFEHALTVPLVMEYEDVLLRPGMVPLPASAAQDVIDYLCATGIEQAVHFLWRPLLPDPKDDMVLEAAAGAGCAWIVTFNTRHFVPAAGLGITAIRPADFLSLLEPRR